MLITKNPHPCPLPEGEGIFTQPVNSGINDTCNPDFQVDSVSGILDRLTGMKA